ncbi:MAG: shikimate dehydrogenase [Myxococcales bacterium]|nr:shikimate dehydrogenase [Myxococcales bacterium]
MITGATRVFALLGSPVQGSPSPQLHNGWFDAHGIDGVYVALPTTDPQAAVAAVRGVQLAGANVTVPLKEGVIPHVDRLTEAARIAGAVNVLWWDGPQLVGDNTDGEGFVLALREEGIDPSGLAITLLGAGGAGRGIAAALARHGVARLHVANRTSARADALVSELAIPFPSIPLSAGPLDDAAIADADLVIVATLPDAPAVRSLDLGRMGTSTIWADIAYRTPEPATSTEARRRGHRVLDGWGMLCWQAALAFERFTSTRPDARIPRAARPW